MPRGARRGSKAAKTRDWNEQARGVLVGRFYKPDSRHAIKKAAGLKGNQSTGLIHSVGTLNKYRQVLKNAGEWVGAKYGVTKLDNITKAQAQAYLDHRAEHGIGQKQLDADRLGLRFLKNIDGLERAIALEPRKLDPRAYTPQQIELIVSRQEAHNALATELAYRSGLRAHEMFTLQRIDEAIPSAHRTWHKDLFDGRKGEIYLVTGKGGLTREVMLPGDLAARLEARRLDTPRTVHDLKIVYQSHYNIGGGNAWSQSVSAASTSAFGWSNGAHGLRHRFAQERLRELQAHGHVYLEAKHILSQEMGHFRPDVVNAYLR